MPSVWLQHNGQAWHVDVGSEEHARLLEEHAVEIDDPTTTKPSKATSKDEPAK